MLSLIPSLLKKESHLSHISLGGGGVGVSWLLVVKKSGTFSLMFSSKKEGSREVFPLISPK